jgi:hypothetical protein
VMMPDRYIAGVQDEVGVTIQLVARCWPALDAGAAARLPLLTALCQWHCGATCVVELHCSQQCWNLHTSRACTCPG